VVAAVAAAQFHEVEEKNYWRGSSGDTPVSHKTTSKRKVPLQGIRVLERIVRL
jgi:hypothetical protein